MRSRRLPSGASDVASDLKLNPDGTLNLLTSLTPTTLGSTGELHALRVFRDDRPVVSLRSAKAQGDAARVTVSVRGVNPIAPASLDANDLRLAYTYPLNGGGRLKTRLISFTQDGDGDLLATYQAARGRGIFSVSTLDGQMKTRLIRRTKAASSARSPSDGSADRDLIRDLASLAERFRP